MDRNPIIERMARENTLLTAAVADGRITEPEAYNAMLFAWFRPVTPAAINELVALKNKCQVRVNMLLTNFRPQTIAIAAELYTRHGG